MSRRFCRGIARHAIVREKPRLFLCSLISREKGMQSSGRSRAFFSAHLSAGATLGQGDEGSGAVEEDATVVRRSALWQVFERSVAFAKRRGHAGRLGR